MAGIFFAETFEGHKFWLVKSAVLGIVTNKNKPNAIFVMVSSYEGGVPLEFKNEEERDEKLEEILEWIS